jgi:alanine dehydrogenase
VKPRPSKAAWPSFPPPPPTWSAVATRSGWIPGRRQERLQRRALLGAGREHRADAATLYEKGELIVKVKEPIAGDLKHLRKDHLLFCYLHLAAEPELTSRLLDIGLTGVAFETVELDNGDLPLLAPMSIIAGRIGVQVGTHLLHQPDGRQGQAAGRPAVDRARQGGGVRCRRRRRQLRAAGRRSGGSNVVVFEKRQDRLAEMMALGANVTALFPYEDVVARELATADLVIGAVLVTGAKAPHVVTREMVASMQKGSVLVDISSTRAAASRPPARPPGPSPPTMSRA